MRWIRLREQPGSIVIVALGLALTAALSWSFLHVPGVYGGQTQLALFSPRAEDGPNPLTVSHGQAILFASVLERSVNGGAKSPRLTDQDISMAEQGERKGTQVRMYNSGGQWADNFDRPYLRIQAVGATESAVRSQLRARVAELRRMANALQEGAGVDRANRAILVAVPTRAQMTYHEGHNAVGSSVTVLLGLSLTGALSRAVRHRGPSPQA